MNVAAILRKSKDGKGWSYAIAIDGKEVRGPIYDTHHEAGMVMLQVLTSLQKFWDTMGIDKEEA